MRIAFTTFGCKVNQYDTDMMRHAAVREGGEVVPFDDLADVYVINTCSVTGKSDYQCRQAIRAAVRRGAGAQVIVTGCYAETRPGEIKRIPGVTRVLGNGEKGELVSFLAACGASSGGNVIAPVRVDHQRTRAFLKVQDGCDSRCAYCIVPLARGSSRSIPREEVVRQFDASVAAGAPEVVLSGIHIGRYGADLSPRSSLSSLVHELAGRREGSRIRLSSIEPGEVTQEIVALIGNGLCSHLHIPLQSGDDRILAAMNRNYSAGTYRRLIESLADKVPGIALGADVMVGFPGEGAREFESTRKLIECLPLTHLHVFSYSPRPGTPASLMSNQVPDNDKKLRSEELRSIGATKNLRFRQGFQGKQVEVVIERNIKNGHCSGLTDNYIRVDVGKVKDGNIQGLVPVRITNVIESATYGTCYSTD